jgi:hypothetical protein
LEKPFNIEIDDRLTLFHLDGLSDHELFLQKENLDFFDRVDSKHHCTVTFIIIYGGSKMNSVLITSNGKFGFGQIPKPKPGPN